jgi:quinol monooxygenase YgiN
MIIVVGEVRFGAGEIERLKSGFAKAIAETRAEDGCEHYAYSVDLADPDLLHVSERWRDEPALDAHMQAPHMAELGALLHAARIEAISIKAYEARYVKTLLGA